MSEEATPVKRRYEGWVILAGLYLVTLGNAVYTAFSRPSPPKVPYQMERTLLRTAVEQRALLERVGQPAPGGDVLGTAVSGLVEPATREPAASRLYAAMRFETGKSVPADQLAPLKASKDPVDQAFFKVYSADRLPETRLPVLKQQLKGEDFLVRLARVHAEEKARVRSARTSLVSTEQLVGQAFIYAGGCGFLFVSGGLWVVYLAQRREGRLEPRGTPLEPMSPDRADAVAMRAAQVFGLSLFISIGLGAALGGGPILLTSSIQGLVLIGAVIWLFRTPVQGTLIGFADVGIRREDLGKNILWGLAGYIANLPFLLFSALVAVSLMPFLPEATHPINEALRSVRDPGAALGLFIAAGVTAPFWEELMFRGLAFPAFSTATKSRIAGAVITSFAFASVHPQGVAAWLALASVAGMSCALCVQTKSLVPSLVLHSVHNAVLLALALLTRTL